MYPGCAALTLRCHFLCLLRCRITPKLILSTQDRRKHQMTARVGRETVKPWADFIKITQKTKQLLNVPSQPPWSGLVAQFIFYFFTILQPPPSSSPHSLPNSSLKASSSACESGLPVLWWMQPHIFFKIYIYIKVAQYWQPKLAAAASSSSLILPLPHPLSPTLCLLWFLDSWRTVIQMLFFFFNAHTSSCYCVVLMGSHRLHLFSLRAGISWDARAHLEIHSPVWFEHNPMRPYCLFFLSFLSFQQPTNVTTLAQMWINIYQTPLLTLSVIPQPLPHLQGLDTTWTPVE